MIKKLIKLKILKFTLVGGLLLAYAVKKYCDKKKNNKKKAKQNTFAYYTILRFYFTYIKIN